MSEPCKCKSIGNGVQLFRIRNPQELFEMIEDLGADYSQYIASKQIWRCKSCNSRFAFLRVPFDKDEEDFLLPVEDPEPSIWNWALLVESASDSRWRGPELDEKFVL